MTSLVSPGDIGPIAQVFVYALWPPSGPRSMIQIGWFGSASRESLLVCPNAVGAAPLVAGAVSTVTARFGRLRSSVLRTVSRIVDGCAVVCRAGNDAFSIESVYSPFGSSASCRPPPQPVTPSTAQTSATAVKALTARERSTGFQRGASVARQSTPTPPARSRSNRGRATASFSRRSDHASARYGSRSPREAKRT
jgi:hypothetical protein